ncbi:MAG: hypothetical protein CVT49_15495 [candidate division Zixibacteria bacterium HGW-Zixibacteria-1]|nr:MAG: hypothetical protein CVT49_15495 [candidate division Zixibacteria bacterium HGW-Zixibacteria-1]
MRAFQGGLYLIVSIILVIMMSRVPSKAHSPRGLINNILIYGSSANINSAFTTEVVTDVEDDEHGEGLPYRFELSQNYPNPFNPVTNIEYSIMSRSQVRIEVFNILGKKVATLVDETKPAGTYNVTWDGRDFEGNPIASGIYLYRFTMGEYMETKKMMLVK